MHHWQWLLIFYGFFYLIIDLRDVANLMLGVASGSHSYSDFISLVIFHIVALFWIIIQKNAVSGGEFTHYLKTLPIPHLKIKIADIVVLTIANNILWIPFFVALFISPDLYGSRLQLFKVFLGLFTTALLTIGIQIQWFSNRKIGLAVAIGADYLIYFSNSHLKGFAAIMMLAVMALFSLYLVFYMLPNLRRFRCYDAFTQIFNINLAEMYSFQNRFPIVNLQCKIIFMENKIYSITRILLAFSSLLFAWATIYYGHEYQLTYSVMIILACASAVFLSGFYRSLDRAHKSMQPYVYTLPLKKYYWPVKDTVFLVTINSLIILPFIIFFLFQNRLSLVDCLLIATIALTLNALLRFSILFGGSHTVFLTSTLTVAWMTLGLYI